jgi:hypothetical protein
MKVIFNGSKTATSAQAVTWQVGRDQVDEQATWWQLAAASSASGGLVAITAILPKMAAAVPISGASIDLNNRVPLTIHGIVKKFVFTPDASCTSGSTTIYYAVGWTD